jgi:rare lipoprotein A (peptidoglycan hydrolase)
MLQGNSVLVKINDRGPFVRKRIIDLSQKAASILGGSLFKIQIEAYTPGSFASADENDKYWFSLISQKLC